MPDIVVFHEGNPFALDAVGHSHFGFAVFGDFEVGVGGVNSRFITAVDGDGIKPEDFEFLLDIAEAHDFVGAAHGLKAIFVDDHDKVIEFEMGGKQQALPNRAFVDFSVAHQYKKIWSV